MRLVAIDPGGSTGVAMAEFNLAAQPATTQHRMRSRTDSSSFTTTGNEFAQVRAIVSEIRRFKPHRIIMEDFILRPGQHGGGKEGLSPLRVGFAIIGMLEGLDYMRMDKVVLQPPSQAHVPSQRLKDWDAWVVGREHERSAWMHAALYIGKCA